MKQVFTSKAIIEIFLKLKKLRVILTFLCIITFLAFLNFSSVSKSQTKKNPTTNQGLIVISDTEYDLNNWEITVRTLSPGNTQSYVQESTGGNPGSFLKMTYELSMANNPSEVYVTYRYKADYFVPTTQGAINSVTGAEDLKKLSGNYPFVTSYPLIFQGGNIFFASDFQSSDPGWISFSRNMTETNYYNLANQQPNNPDFSANGDTIWFGFARRAKAFDPPVNYSITHGSDNFSVTIYPEGGNNPPIAVDDQYVYSKNSKFVTLTFQVLKNDYDPNGDELQLVEVFDEFNGTATIMGNVIEFYIFNVEYASFQYIISDGEFTDTAKAIAMADCGCDLDCLYSLKIKKGLVNKVSQQDTLDLDLIRRFRDEVMEPSYHGSRYVDMYYETTPEILYILLIQEPDLAVQAVTMVELLQPAIRNILDGDGTEPITQTQINAIESFFANLSAAGSTSLQQLIDEEMQRLGPLQNYVGMPISDVIFQTMVTDVGDNQNSIPTDYYLAQNYPNPFNPSTKISWQSPVGSHQTLKIYDLLGNEVAVLVDEYLPAGTYEVEFSVGQDSSPDIASGIYFYKLQAGDPSTGSGQGFVETKKMLLLK